MNRPIIIVIISVIFAISCKNEKQQAPALSVSGKMNFAYLRYDSAALEYRLDSVHNRRLILQFLLKNAGDNNSPYQLIAYAFDTLGDYNNSWMPDTLGIVRDTMPAVFDGKITLGNSEITREELLNVVRDDQGNRFSYDYVLFTPVVEGVFNHVVYRIRPVKNNKPVSGSKMQMSTPMPPGRVWE